MGGDTFKKVAQLSNPIGQLDYAYTHATGNESLMPRIRYKGASMQTTGQVLYDAPAAAKVQDVGRKNEVAAEKLDKELKSDEEKFQKFKAQEATLLDGKSSEIFVPQYKHGKRASETDALAKIFQARKSEVAQRKATPGISQTRFGA